MAACLLGFLEIGGTKVEITYLAARNFVMDYNAYCPYNNPEEWIQAEDTETSDERSLSPRRCSMSISNLFRA